MEDDGLHQTWAGEDIANNEEEGSLVMTIVTMRLDGFYRVTLQTLDDGHHNKTIGRDHRDISGRGRWPFPLL